MSAFLPRLWPIYNVIVIATLPKDKEIECKTIKPKSRSILFQIISRELAVLTYLSVALIVYFYGYSAKYNSILYHLYIHARFIDYLHVLWRISMVYV